MYIIIENEVLSSSSVGTFIALNSESHWSCYCTLCDSVQSYLSNKLGFSLYLKFYVVLIFPVQS
jgi:hypothetical protein